MMRKTSARMHRISPTIPDCAMKALTALDWISYVNPNKIHTAYRKKPIAKK